VTGEDDKKTLETLRAVSVGIDAIYQSQPEKFMFYNKMRAPIKRIQNKYRYQILMRLGDTSVLQKIYEICAEERNRDALVSLLEASPAELELMGSVSKEKAKLLFSAEAITEQWSNLIKKLTR
jgi:hypothetical protein